MSANTNKVLRRSLRARLGAVAGLSVAPALRAQGARPLVIVAPFPPGGSTDLMARLVAEGWPACSAGR